ncbi:MAG: hypothetical protein COC00_007615 [Rhizobiales bacterium]|nr:hypothetical protein [Hyphomicrobiales bacterium]
MPNKKHSRNNLTLYGVSLSLALLAGASPAALTLFVDPYEIFSDKDRTSKITDIAEKRHYPLWKLARYKKGQHDTIILGDSRARSLKDKYWIELGVSKALNLAYGGGTIPEIYSTFNHLKNDPAIKNIVIGIQLRSFDEKHKGGLNRVPEAIRILDNQLEYVKNWIILNTAFDMFRVENKTTLEQINSYVPTLVGSANAAELCTKPKRNICLNCSLPKNLSSVPFRIRSKGPNLGLGRGNRYDGVLGYMSSTQWKTINGLYTLSSIDRTYSKKITRQIKRNGNSDWRNFQFSEKYWAQLVEISNWAKANNKTITYIIPPTVQGMQNTIKINSLAPLNHKLRIELAKLGNVYDFDFGNKITADGNNFTDAYHFNSKIARQIVGEVALSIAPTSKRLVLKRRGKIKCTKTSTKSKKLTDAVEVLLFDFCRVWKEAKS